MLAQPYDWILRCSVEILLILFLAFVLLKPLWKLAQTRLALIILFSRAIASLLRLLADLPGFVTNYVFLYSPWLYIYLTNSFLFTFETALSVHILALAMNRAHAILFPFHYKLFSKNMRNFYIICLLLWIFSLIIGFADPLVKETSNNTIFPFSIVHQISMASGAICYGALTCKFVWFKYRHKSMAGASAEKDTIKIVFVCFSGLFMASLRYFILSPFLIFVNANWPDVPRTIFYWFTFLSTVMFSRCAEYICLLFLVGDYRKHIGEQIQQILCCKKSASTGNTTHANETTFKNKNNIKVVSTRTTLKIDSRPPS